MRGIMKIIVLAIVSRCVAQAQADNRKSWDRQAARAYLDGRMGWWAAWPSAARDHETFCVSCHTSLPYALARPALRSALGEQGPSASERKFLDNIAKRVSLWAEVQPFYSDAKNGAPKSAESRGTEAVLNALALASYQRPDAKDALRNMWALQLKTGEKRGAWTWLNFHNEPLGGGRLDVLGRGAGGPCHGTGTRRLPVERRDSGESGVAWRAFAARTAKPVYVESRRGL